MWPPVPATKCSRGDAFFDTNAELLDQYAACPTAADVIAVQNEFLEATNTRKEGTGDVDHALSVLTAV